MTNRGPIGWRKGVALWIYQMGLCYYCEQSLEPAGEELGDLYPHNAEIDHLVPLSKGGSNDLYNLVVACRGCNREKGQKDHQQFFDFCRFSQDDDTFEQFVSYWYDDEDVA